MAHRKLESMHTLVFTMDRLLHLGYASIALVNAGPLEDTDWQAYENVYGRSFYVEIQEGPCHYMRHTLWICDDSKVFQLATTMDAPE